MMAKLVIQIYLSYSQLCVFLTSLTNPFNDWSDRSFSQGFSWRDGSVSFRALREDGDHQINLFIDEPIPGLVSNVQRAFRVPFETMDGHIEVASISDSACLEVPPGKYCLQVEFLAVEDNGMPEVNVRLNKGGCGFELLKADDQIVMEGELDISAESAI
ncbi:MAG TPA: competence protein ComJ [Cellvibrionaceae bacterium]|nr:competence protein ComJ [Cellvibrionaceae bacterium]HNG58565.1 competence protein ComJ [Cellvibrionaceae bacterium]